MIGWWRRGRLLGGLGGKIILGIPFSWVEFGWRLGSRFVSELQDMDLDDMTDALEQDVEGYILQVEDEDDNKRVEIFVD